MSAILQPRLRLPLLLALAVVIMGLPPLVEFYTDWLWFQEVGYTGVFVRTLTARTVLGVAIGLLVFAFLHLNLRLALRDVRRREFTIMTPEGPRTVAVDPGRMRPLISAGAGFGALLIGLISASRWEDALFFLYGVPFSTVDPILGWDIGFYVFRLPFLQFLYGLALFVIVVTAIGVSAAHVAAGNLGLDPNQGLVTARGAVRHLAALAAGFFLVLAVGAWLDVPATLTSPGEIVYGASYVDVNARVPALRLLLGAAIVAAGLALYQIVVPRFWPILAAVGLYVAVAGGGAVYAMVIQRFVVAPNQQVRETPYIVHNIAATREAFGLASVDERPLSGEATLTREDIGNNSATLDNIPLWNDQPLLDTFGQIQEIRTYYDFVSVDNDRYTINGDYRQVMLSARELNTNSLPSRTWINERLTFTHGYGITLGPTNEVTSSGLPVLFVQDLPQVSSVDLELTQPAIYFGELSSDHVFVNTRTEEFDYPRGDDNVFTTYAGEGGIQLSGLFRRLLFAIRFRSTDTLFSPNLTAESRVLLYRQIAERVERIAPILTYDSDPYVAIADGRLVWIQDAYTASDQYPYSAQSRVGLNYIRNAVKATIDAYHGTVRFHVIDPDDPIVRTIGLMFPGLFEPLEAMPEDLRTRLRYPQSIFTIQAEMLSTYHMTNPAVFYNREDQWEVPAIDVGGQATRMEPYYTIMRLPGESEAEYIQMLPYTPRQKDNLAAWMVARSDGDNYGQLVTFQFPKETVIFGPRQIAARISQDQVIAPQVTLWNQQGSEVIQGTLLVIPIEESLIYVRPLYLRGTGGRIPELTRVIVAYRNEIVMERTFDEAIDRLFPEDGRPARDVPRPAVTGGEVGVAPGPAPEIGDEGFETDLTALARQHYERAIEAQRNGDWALYGEEIRRLGDVLDRMAPR